MKKSQHNKCLILGGTTEASQLCAQFEGGDADVTLSLAGATRYPIKHNIPTRIGGFGGIKGLQNWLEEHGVSRVVDATHPFAAQMSDHAYEACHNLGIPLLRLERPPWKPQKGDRWFHVGSIEEAARLLAYDPSWNKKVHQVFLTTGRKHLAPFKIARQHHYLVRSVDPPSVSDRPEHITCLNMRGPFKKEDEVKLFTKFGIDVLVTKNSGGEATYPKLVVAREQGVPVLMVDRPSCVGDVKKTGSVSEAYRWCLGSMDVRCFT